MHNFKMQARKITLLNYKKTSQSHLACRHKQVLELRVIDNSGMQALDGG